MPLLKWGAWTPDTIDYEAATPKTILNVIPRADGYGPFPGVSTYTQALPAACRGGFYALKSDGTVVTFAGTATKLYRLNNTDYSWVDVSKGGGTYTTPTFGSLAANWQFAQFGSLVFATQANTVLQVYDLGSSTQFADCAGSPPQAAYIAVVGRFLVLSGLLSNPYRIQWSGLNATTTWTSGVNSSDFQDFPDGGIVRGVAGGTQSGVILQDNAIRNMAYVQGSPLIFQIDRIAQDKGLYAPYSIIRAGERVFFYANQGFHKIDPGGIPQPIGRERVDRTFIADLDTSNLQFFQGAADPRSSRIYWAYKSVAGAVGGYDKLLGYDYLLDQFFPVKTSGQFLVGISQSGITLEGLDSISTNIDSMSLSLDAYTIATAPQLGNFDTTNKFGFFVGLPLEATLLSGEQGGDEDRLNIRGFRPITDAPSVFGALVYRDSQQATPITTPEMGMSRIAKIDIRRDARYARFQLRIPAGTSWNFCAGVVPDFVSGGQQ